MRRIVGLVLVALGVALISLAIALPTYVYPRVAKAPVDPNETLRAEGTGITVLLPRSIEDGGTQIYTDQTVVNLRKVRGEVRQGAPAPNEDQRFYRQEFRVDVEGKGLLTAKTAVYDLLRRGAAGARTAPEREWWSRLTSGWDAYFAEDDALLEQIEKDPRAGVTAAKASFNEGTTHDVYGRISDAIDELDTDLRTRMIDEQAYMAKLRDTSIAVLVAALAAALLAAATLSAVTTRIRFVSVGL